MHIEQRSQVATIGGGDVGERGTKDASRHQHGELDAMERSMDATDRLRTRQCGTVRICSMRARQVKALRELEKRARRIAQHAPRLEERCPLVCVTLCESHGVLWRCVCVYRCDVDGGRKEARKCDAVGCRPQPTGGGEGRPSRFPGASAPSLSLCWPTGAARLHPHPSTWPEPLHKARKFRQSMASLPHGGLLMVYNLFRPTD